MVDYDIRLCCSSKDGLPTCGSSNFEAFELWAPLAVIILTRLVFLDQKCTSLESGRQAPIHICTYCILSIPGCTLFFTFSHFWNVNVLSISLIMYNYSIITEFSFLLVHKIIVHLIINDILETMKYRLYQNLWEGGWLTVWILQKFSRWVWCTLLAYQYFELALGVFPQLTIIINCCHTLTFPLPRTGLSTFHIFISYFNAHNKPRFVD